MTLSSKFFQYPTIGIVQINGATYPAVTDNYTHLGAKVYLIDYNGELMVCRSPLFYRLSRYEFYKWYPSPVFDYLIQWHDDTTFVLYQVTTHEPVIMPYSAYSRGFVTIAEGN